jgi:hypothetical protein
MRLAVCNGDLKTASKASQTGMAAGNPASPTNQTPIANWAVQAEGEK